MPDLSTLGPGHRSTLDAIFWPIDEGYNDWLEPLKGRQRRFQGQKGPRMRMQFRHPECFIDERNGDLGPYVRYLIALRFVLRRRSPKSSWSQILAANRERTAREVFTPILKLDDEELLDSFQSAFYQDSNAWKTAGRYMHGRLFDRILALVNGERGDLTALTRAQFLEVGNLREGESLESRTLGQFQHWLENGVHPPNDDLRNLMCEELLRSNSSKADSRDDQLEQIFKLLRRPQREGHVINVFGKNCATGLRAFSTALLEELVRHRGAGDPDSPVGLIYLRLTRSQLGEGVPTPASVVRLLRNAFGLPLEPDREGGSRPIDLHADLEPITRAMSIYKTIVVVDGLATSEGPVAALLDMIRNTQWIELLRVLIQPHQQTLLRRGASYPSRIVILSSEPVSQLEPWMIVAPQRLGAVPEEVDARSLLVESKARAARLATLSAQLDARVSMEGLDQLFPLNDDQREALFVGRQPHQLPSELDLSLACLHSGKDLRAMRQLNQSQGVVNAHSLRHEQLARWMQGLSAQVASGETGYADLVALKFVACSINGLRISTLARCIRVWIDLHRQVMTSDQIIQLNKLIESRTTSEALAQRHPHIMILSRDEDVEAIGLRQRRFELQQFPFGDETPATTADDRPLLDLRLEGFRELMLAQMIGGGTGQASDVLTPNPRAEWELINRVLAEESLRQATTQLRNLNSRERNTPAVYRRLVQCVFHGLLSHSYDNLSANDTTPLQPQHPTFTLPPEPFRRFRYLFAFVFRHCIEEAPSWTMSRGFVRSEMRFALLSMFASPRWGVELIGSLHRMDSSQRAMRGSRALSEAASLAKISSEDRSAWIARDASLQIDILEALGRSAYDTGRHRFVEGLVQVIHRRRGARTDAGPPVVSVSARPGGRRIGGSVYEHLGRIEAALHALKDMAVEDGSLPPAGLQHDPVHHSFMKLLIDSRIARARHRRARLLCERWLTEHGVDCREFLALGSRYMELAKEVSGDASPKAQFEEQVLQPLMERVLAWSTMESDRVAIADMLSRLGQSDAETDELGGAMTRRDRLAALMTSYSIFWIADRVRSAASGVSDSVAWPRVSSRAMRYFIRVSLRLAEIRGAGAAVASPDRADSLAFYAHARRRMDVYASHHFRLPRERLAMLILMASASQVWAGIGDPAQGKESRLADLEASLGYLEQAEVVLFELGFPEQLAYRFLLTRSETYRQLSHPHLRSNQIYGSLCNRDLDTLRRLVLRNPLWKRVVSQRHLTQDMATMEQ